jgi:predicted ABC-class ATPase
MRTVDDLADRLHRIDGRGYSAYKDIRGEWGYDGFTLSIVHVQGDPFATPSRLRLLIPGETAGLDSWILERPSRREGAAAWIAHAFAEGVAHLAPGRGSGRSGRIAMASPGQLVLPQSAVRIDDAGEIEARFTLGLPARGRRVMGREAARIFREIVPRVVEAFLAEGAHSPEDLRRAAAVNEDADALRARLPDRGLVGFLARGSLLPRRSGVDDRPLEKGAVPLETPPSLEVTLEAPNAGAVTGMGIPEGVTLVVGGGFHGKSTLLRALETGVYNHRPGDGREQVVTRRDAVKLRAEDGRAVTDVDISPFIGDLPGDRGTTHFSTANASGSTSQAAGLVEALEIGAKALLFDEDTAATNFLIRDRRMQALVPGDQEPITPLVDRIEELYESLGVSAVLVLGGSGDYLDVADTVVGMVDYLPFDLTAEARRVAGAHPTGRRREVGAPLSRPRRRTVLSSSLPGGRPGGRGTGRRREGAGPESDGRGALRVRTLEGRRLRVGDHILDLSALEQLLLPTQLRTVASVLELWARRPGIDEHPLAEVVAGLEERLREDLDAVDPRATGDLAWVRRFELAGALNRLRTLAVC